MPKPVTLCLLLSLTFSVNFSSCRVDTIAEKNIITAMEKSLQSSNQNLNLSTALQLKLLEDKKTEPCSKERAEKWFPIAYFISKTTRELFDFLAGIKRQENYDAPNLTTIILKLRRFKEMVLSANERIKEEFQHNLNFINESVSLLGGDSTLTDGGFTRSIPTYPYQAILSIIQNEITKTADRMISFCNMQVSDCGWKFDSYSVIVAPNSNYLKPGSPITITAGVGVFSKEADPRIKVYGRFVPLEPEGFVLYKGKAPSRAGNYTVPVEITYTNKYTGLDETKIIQVEYTVVHPCADQ